MNIKETEMKKVISITGAALLLSSCMATGDQVRTGGIVGCSALGATVGGLLMRNSSTGARVAAGIGTAALCGVVANAWANHLDEQDRQRLADASAEAAATNRESTFSNPENGVRGKVRVVNVKKKETVSTNVVVLKDRVEQTPPLELIQTNFEANSTANVRGGPGTDYKSVGRLSGGDVRKVIGKVQERNWYLIDEGGAGSGYVYANLLKPTDKEPPQLTLHGETSTAQVSASLSCKTVQQDVTTKTGENVTKTMEMCQQKDGSWEFETV